MEACVKYSREDFVRDLVECLVRAANGKADMLYGKIKRKNEVSAIYNIVKTVYNSLKKRGFLTKSDLEAIYDALKTFETVPKFNKNKALLLIVYKLRDKENGILQLVKTDKTPTEEEVKTLLDNVIKELKAEQPSLHQDREKIVY